MGKGTFIATVALLIAIAGAIVAFAAYFKHRSCTLCEDFDDMMDDDADDLDYYATPMDDDGEDISDSAAVSEHFTTQEEDGSETK